MAAKKRQATAEEMAECSGIHSRLKEIASDMQAMAERENPAADGAFKLLESEASDLTARLAELRAECELTIRRTTPNRTGSHRGGQSVTGEYAKLHNLTRHELTDAGFSSLGDFFQTLVSGRYDPRLSGLSAAASGKMYGTGGVLIPERFVNDQLHAPTESEVVLPRARVYPMDSAVLHVSGVAGLDETDGNISGFVSEWVPELGEFNEQDIKTARITLTRSKLGIYTKASNELLMASDFERVLIPALNAAISDSRDQAFLHGNGVGQPCGVFSSANPALLTISPETNQPNNSVVFENLAKMYGRLHPALIGNAVWVVSPTTIPQLLQIYIPHGTSGTTVPVLTGSGGEMRMFDLPIIKSSKMLPLGTAGDVGLVAFSEYAVGLSRNIIIDKSEHVGFQTDTTAWRARMLADGQSRWPSVHQPRNGDSLSWAVRLADRA